MATRKNVTKEEVKKQVELGKAVNARVSEKTKLLKEQNACLAKRCNNLEAQISALNDEIKELKKRNVNLEITLTDTEKSKQYFTKLCSELQAKNKRLAYVKDCIILGSLEKRHNEQLKAEKYYDDKIDKLRQHNMILKGYYIQHYSVEDLMILHQLPKYIIESIVFAEETCCEEE